MTPKKSPAAKNNHKNLDLLSFCSVVQHKETHNLIQEAQASSVINKEKEIQSEKPTLTTFSISGCIYCMFEGNQREPVYTGNRYGVAFITFWAAILWKPLSLMTALPGWITALIIMQMLFFPQTKIRDKIIYKIYKLHNLTILILLYKLGTLWCKHSVLMILIF